ncbi:MAG: hypothetical protein AB1649_19750 [Chloroflexota bacterium]
MNPDSDFKRASEFTAKSLKDKASSREARKLSRLSLPEIEKVSDLVSKVIPAGNVPGMILSGLTRISGKHQLAQKVRQDITTLFKEMNLLVDQAKYQAIFATPAMVIWGYQNLLKLAGKDPEDSFPEGIWQFYVDYALREDTARHANETHGFDTVLEENGVHLQPVDRVTAWAMAAITCLHQYPALLANEWYERTCIALLQDVAYGTPLSARYARLYREWETRRPYGRDADAASYDYPGYRRHVFDEFLKKQLKALPDASVTTWKKKLAALTSEELPAYQKQMSILASLEPGPYGETRAAFPWESTHIGIIYRDSYFLLPVSKDGTSEPVDVLTVRAQVADILSCGPQATGKLKTLARVVRSAQPSLRQKFNRVLQEDLKRLRTAPILINAEHRERAQPLAQVRDGERGVGDHSLTIFDTGSTFVFDQSHIFFDGAWGAALAEIITNEALSWAAYLHMLPPLVLLQEKKYQQLKLPFEKTDLKLLEQARPASMEAGAETDRVNLKACQSVRKLFKQRNDLLRLTINDLLVLYRAIHAVTYQPSNQLLSQINDLSRTHPVVSAVIQQSWQDARRVNPSILIPMDASKRVPRDRLYPLNIEAPLAELDLINLHKQTIQALETYKSSLEDRDAIYSRFDVLQKFYLATLAGFGEILNKAKQIAIQGESASVGAIRLLANLPLPLQRLLDKVPSRFDVVNDLIKGNEVFSNLGAVAQNSSLTRFLTAKDDNNEKHLAWGILTDAGGVMHISLRDFRPHVAALHRIGRQDLADQIAQDYLDAYASGLNQYIADLSRITLASRETQQRNKRDK